VKTRRSIPLETKYGLDIRDCTGNLTSLVVLFGDDNDPTTKSGGVAIAGLRFK